MRTGNKGVLESMRPNVFAATIVSDRHAVLHIQREGESRGYCGKLPMYPFGAYGVDPKTQKMQVCERCMDGFKVYVEGEKSQKGSKEKEEIKVNHNHHVKESYSLGYRHCVAFRNCTPTAHGGAMHIEVCGCGARRYVNRNGKEEEVGAWCEPVLELDTYMCD